MASSKLYVAVDEGDRIIKEKLRDRSACVATAVVTQVAQERDINVRTLIGTCVSGMVLLWYQMGTASSVMWRRLSWRGL